MISKRDSKPFLVKFPIGTVRNISTDKQYEEVWNTCCGLISDPSGSILNRIYGNELDYDKVLILNYGSNSKRINYDSKLLLENMPTDTYSDGDYSVSRIFPVYNNEIVIGLSRKEAVNVPKIYFYKDNTLMFVQFNLDTQTNRIYAGKNDIVPFNVGEHVWLREPSDKNDKSYRYRVGSFNNVGFTNWYKPFLEIVLEEDSN